MQPKWLAKSATAIALVAVMATETVNPVPAYAGVPGIFATARASVGPLLMVPARERRKEHLVVGEIANIHCESGTPLTLRWSAPSLGVTPDPKSVVEVKR